MRIVIMLEVIALLILPLPLAILRKRGKGFVKPISFIVSTLFGLFIGSYWLYVISPESPLLLTSKDWVFAIALAILCWIFLYLILLWLYKHWLQK